MPIYRIDENRIVSVPDTSFEAIGIMEHDLQSLLRKDIEAVSPDTLIIGEEVGLGAGSQLRVDLLGIDRDANLVVIELKRTQDAGWAELQAIRYAALISNITFERAVAIYNSHLRKFSQDNGEPDKDMSERRILDFLEWTDPDEDSFGQDTRIVIVAAGFSAELITTVVWLNGYDLDIRCVRTKPYKHDGILLLDIQTMIPLPELSDYQMQRRDKYNRERASRRRSLEKYHLTIGRGEYRSLNKRKIVDHLIAGATNGGRRPTEVLEITSHIPMRLFRVIEGEINLTEAKNQVPDPSRYFLTDETDVYHDNGNTYLLSNQWAHRQPYQIAEAMQTAFPELEITISVV